MNKRSRTLFVPPPGRLSGIRINRRSVNAQSLGKRPGLTIKPLLTTSARTGVKMLDRAIDMTQKAYAGYDSMPAPQQEFIRVQASNLGASMMRKFVGDGPSFEQHESHSSGYGLNNPNPPKQVRLDTGIKPAGYVNNIHEAVENKCSPLHLSAIRLTLPNVATSSIINKINNLYQKMANEAQDSVSFYLSLSNFSQTKLFAYLNAVLYALQVYYYYNSIITNCKFAEPQNQGMFYIRGQITAEMMNSLAQLEERLTLLCIPPNLFEFVRYFQSTYSTGTTQSSPLLKICPFALNTNGVSLSAITGALSGLISQDNYDVQSILVRVAPEWRVSELPSIPGEPLYDPNFNTIFANLPFYIDAAAPGGTSQPVVTASTTDIQYCSYTNALDGVAMAMTSIYLNSGTPAWTPSLVYPVGTAGTLGNRYSYYKISGTAGLVSVHAYPILTRTRNETFYISDPATVAVSSGHVYGTSLVQGINCNTISQCAENAVEWLSSVDMITPRNKSQRRSGYDKSSSRPGNSRPKREKPVREDG